MGVLALGEISEESLLLQIGLNLSDLVVFSSGESQVVDGLVIDWEVAHGGAVFGCHVGDGGSVSEGKRCHTRAEELNKLANDSSLPQDLGGSQHQISCGAIALQLAMESEANHLRQHHGDCLAQHYGLSLNAADPPADHSQTVDHGGVTVSTHNRIRVQQTLLISKHHASQVLQIHLVNDARPRRNNQEVLKGSGAPLQKLKSLKVPLKLDFLILLICVRNTGNVSLH